MSKEAVKAIALIGAAALLLAAPEVLEALAAVVAIL
jgi:hypothetical protein